jgi:hypothetical protein
MATLLRAVKQSVAERLSREATAKGMQPREVSAREKVKVSPARVEWL